VSRKGDRDNADVGARALAAVSEARLVDLVSRMIATPSPTGDERACAEVVASHMSAHGLVTDVQVFQERRANAIATLPGSGNGVRLMFNGHLDTSTGGDPRLRVENGIVHGLGAFNMKGGVAAAAEAVVALKEAGVDLPGDVVLAAVAGESEKAPVRAPTRNFLGAAYEGNGVGTLWMLQHARRPDAVVIMEPCDLWVVNAQPGYFFVKLSFTGRTIYQGSRSRVFAEESSIDLACRAAAAIKAWEPEYRERFKLECGMGTLYPNVTVGSIEAGELAKPTTWPGVAAISVDVRVPPHVDGEHVLSALDGVVRSALGPSARDKYTFEIFASNMPGSLTDVDHPLVQAALSARASVVGAQDRHPDANLASGDDGKLFANLGIANVKVGPASQVGPNEEAPTRPDGQEWVKIKELVQAAKLYALLAVDIAARDRGEMRDWPKVRVQPADFEGR
jgi:acetylornithine deacetylase/succinyl-diaminopimelate desuccinylase-like protein